MFWLLLVVKIPCWCGKDCLQYLPVFLIKICEELAHGGSLKTQQRNSRAPTPFLSLTPELEAGIRQPI